VIDFSLAILNFRQKIRTPRWYQLRTAKTRRFWKYRACKSRNKTPLSVGGSCQLSSLPLLSSDDR